MGKFIKKIVKFFCSKLFIYNSLALIAFLTLSFFAFQIYLKFYTNHGEAVTTPNLRGVSLEEAIATLEESGLEYQIFDTVFDSRYQKGAIAGQNPESEALVKEGRKIYLTLNSDVDEIIPMPNFNGMSMRMVNSQINSYGLEVGKLKYIQDIGKNIVLEQQHNGETVAAGTKITKGSKIDFVLGIGQDKGKTTVPSVIGFTMREASRKLSDKFLNIGTVNYDSTVLSYQDTLDAKVHKQSPRASTINEVKLGYSVDVWLTTDESLLND